MSGLKQSYGQSPLSRGLQLQMLPVTYDLWLPGSKRNHTSRVRLGFSGLKTTARAVCNRMAFPCAEHTNEGVLGSTLGSNAVASGSRGFARLGDLLLRGFNACKNQRLCLVQRAVSIMLYGNGTSKQVFYK